MISGACIICILIDFGFIQQILDIGEIIWLEGNFVLFGGAADHIVGLQLVF
jgi:hypothetical protein